MRPSAATVAMLWVLGACLAAPQPGYATIPLQKQAMALGYPADDCSYCHVFDMGHMEEEARRAGLQTTNCITCHGNQLPLSGKDLFNARGRYLLERKEARHEDEPDMAWLADYVEEDEPEGGAAPEEKTPDPNR